ncbi:hypothetical protein [Microbacterium hominis]|uniref:Uncharacterized protein n=1 Tax=Microbacterium hominis TaxID=162426 RepID=A0A7D4U2Q3_9MICO|nr:hypothetical protein [Microbacterium hominis]QKJ18145.1 hypothetical protein HQM25_01090 [Microbacterium hominis]
MDEGSLVELRALRERAYGRDADIDDPADLERLRELEERSRASVAVAAERPGDTTGASAPAAPAPAAPAPAAPAKGEETPAATAASPGPRRRRAWWWALSLVVTAVTASLVTAWLLAPDARVASLEIDRETPWPTHVLGDRVSNSAVYEPFHGVSPIAVFEGPQAPAPCLYLVTWFAGGAEFLSRGSCTVGGFPATVALTVDASSPDELRDAFGLGTSVQFVLDEARVSVYVDAP